LTDYSVGTGWSKWESDRAARPGEAVARALSGQTCAASRNFRRKLRSPSSASPDKGNVGTAAYLDVWLDLRGDASTPAQRLRCSGLASSALALIEVIRCSSQYSSPELNIAYRMSVPGMKTYSQRLEENWGPPPGHLNSDGQNLLYGSAMSLSGAAYIWL